MTPFEIFKKDLIKDKKERDDRLMKAIISVYSEKYKEELAMIKDESIKLDSNKEILK